MSGTAKPEAGTIGTVGTVGSDARTLDLARLNEILFAEDLAQIFRVSVSQARQNLTAGLYGPYFQSGKRRAILRALMLEHLREISVRPRDSEERGSGRGEVLVDLVSRRRTRLPEAS